MLWYVHISFKKLNTVNEIAWTRSICSMWLICTNRANHFFSTVFHALSWLNMVVTHHVLTPPSPQKLMNSSDNFYIQLFHWHNTVIIEQSQKNINPCSCSFMLYYSNTHAQYLHPSLYHLVSDCNIEGLANQTASIVLYLVCIVLTITSPPCYNTLFYVPMYS